LNFARLFFTNVQKTDSEMKLTLVLVGKTSFPFVKEGMEMYEKRIHHHISYSRIEIPDIKGTKSLSPLQVKEKEGDEILRRIGEKDDVILLDERGEDFSSVEWAGHLEKRIISGGKNIVFVVGGAYGFSQRVYSRADSKLSLSRMTLSHQLVRLFFTEQLYRALSIINGEPYHNE